ncbi:hypothetical protein PV326_010688 [Microctonus aethiopoides]|nr:hypothetical protein PV326_010688 [Microctonus aethiopoides]
MSIKVWVMNVLCMEWNSMKSKSGLVDPSEPIELPQDSIEYLKLGWHPLEKERFRSELSSKIKQVKQQFFQNKLNPIKDSPTLWRVLLSLGLTKQSTSSPLHFFTTNQLIEYYSSITSNTNPCAQADLNRAINLSHHESSHLEFTCIDPIEVHQLILSSVSNTHSTGPDSISASTIRLPSRSLAHVAEVAEGAEGAEVDGVAEAAEIAEGAEVAEDAEDVEVVEERV